MREESDKTSIGDLSATDRDVLNFVSQLQTFSGPPEPQAICELIQKERDVTQQTIYRSLDNLADEYECLERIENQDDDQRKSNRYKVSERGQRFLKTLYDQYIKINHVFDTNTDAEDNRHGEKRADGGIAIKQATVVRTVSVAESLYGALAARTASEETLYKLSEDPEVDATREQIERAVRLYPSQFAFGEAVAERNPSRTAKTVRLTEEARSKEEPNWRVVLG